MTHQTVISDCAEPSCKKKKLDVSLDADAPQELIIECNVGDPNMEADVSNLDRAAVFGHLQLLFAKLQYSSRR